MKLVSLRGRCSNKDVKNPIEPEERYGYKTEITSEALNSIIRKHLKDLPCGYIERMQVDHDRMVLTLYYRSPKPTEKEKNSGKRIQYYIGEGQTYPVNNGE